MKWLKKLFHFHDWLHVGKIELPLPPRGPYDPRTEADRMREHSVWICVSCGETDVRLPCRYIPF